MRFVTTLRLQGGSRGVPPHREYRRPRRRASNRPRRRPRNRAFSVRPRPSAAICTHLQPPAHKNASPVQPLAFSLQPSLQPWAADCGPPPGTAGGNQTPARGGGVRMRPGVRAPVDNSCNEQPLCYTGQDGSCLPLSAFVTSRRGRGEHYFRKLAWLRP